MLPRLRSFVTTLVFRDHFEGSLDEEVRFHLDAQTEDLVRAGVPRAEAAFRARRQFGSIEAMKEECRRARGLRRRGRPFRNRRPRARTMRPAETPRLSRGLERLLRTVGPVVATCLVAGGVHAQPKTVETDRAALVALYDATAGSSWHVNTNWLGDEPLSAWHGVATNASGRVTDLTLGGNNLSGELPAVLGDLTELRRLDLQWNRLTGELPSSLGNLSDLQVLILGRNGLTGPIPAELANPAPLWSLVLSYNDLTGPIPAAIGDMASLEYLSLRANGLSGAVPAALANVDTLRELTVGFNQGLSGSLPSGLADLTDLAHVEIHGTSVCVPSGTAFRAWASTIRFESSGLACGTEPSANPVVDVAVFYTPAARRAAGGTSRIEATIDLLVAETNKAYRDSGVRQTIELVAREEVPYAESESSILDLERLTDPADGHLDGVHPIRDVVGADLVHLIVGNATVAGVANSAPRADEAFSLSLQGSGGITFAHELGHSMGLSHDRYEQCSTGPCTWAPHYPYGFGYVNQKAFEAGAPASARWHTIMAYSNQCAEQGGVSCEQLALFSNPNEIRGGDPLGAPGDRDAAGLIGPSDAVRALNDARHSIASFRQAVSRDADHVPMAVGRLPDRMLRVGGAPVVVDISGAFLDPDGDVLTHSAVSAVEAVATVQVAEARLTISPVAAGVTTITVTATDTTGSNGSAWQQFAVFVDDANAVDYDTDDDGLIEVRTLAQLDAMRYDANGDGDPLFGQSAYGAAFPEAGVRMGCAGGACSGYELVESLDFDTNGSGGPDAGDAYWNGGAGWEPIGSDTFTAFAATLQGNGHTISHLFINRSTDAGFFGRTNRGAVIMHLGLLDVDVTGEDVGGLVGTNQGRIIGSHVTGRLTGTDLAGGLAADNGGEIVHSRASGFVTGGAWVGGLVGWNTGRVAGSYAASRVAGAAGGLVGTNSGVVIASYAAGPVRAVIDGGGLVARNAGGRVVASYATSSFGGDVHRAGGLVGAESAGAANVTASYWDTTTSGKQSSGGGTGRTTAELQAPTDYRGIYADWNVDLDGDGTADDPWHFGTAEQYPALKANLDGRGAATWQEFGHQLRAGPTLTATAEGEAVALSWTAADTSPWNPPPDVTYNVTRDDGTEVTVIAEALGALTVTDTAGPAGATYTYQVASAVDGGEAARSARVTAAAAGTCRYAVTPPHRDVPWTAGVEQVAVTTGAGCAWTAASESAFLAVTAGATGSGPGTVRYAVAENAGGPRRGALTVAGRRVTVYQAASPRRFTDHPLEPGVTPIKAIHFLELRARIDALRTAAGRPAFQWTDPTLTPGATPVRRVHLTELRAALAEAYTAAGRAAPTYSDPVVAGGMTAIRAAHLMELRASVAALE